MVEAEDLDLQTPSENQYYVSSKTLATVRIDLEKETTGLDLVAKVVGSYQFRWRSLASYQWWVVASYMRWA